MRQTLTLLALALASGTAFAQVNGTQNPTDANGPTPPASTSTDPMAPQATSRAVGSRPPADQNPTDANGPSANANGRDVTAPQAAAGAPISTVNGSGTPTTSAPGTDDISAPSTHTRTPDQTTHKRRRHPRG